MIKKSIYLPFQPSSNGVSKMKPFSALLPVVLLLACLVIPCMALESTVFSISEKTLSLDLGPNFDINKGELNTSERGLVSQDFLINSTAAPGAAFISVMSVYGEVMGKMSPSSLSELFLMGGMSAVEARGDVEIGNWTAIDSLGNNVTVHTLFTKDERIQQLGGTYYIAVWDLDGSSYAVMTSLLDQNNTTQLIKTLAIQ
jgi:hypothetical protein